MQLLPNYIKKQIPPLYSQENNPDPKVVCKFFDPTGSWTWYVIEGQQQENDYLFFGYVIGHEAELGYFTLSQLIDAKRKAEGFAALPIERDLYFTPQRLSSVKRLHNIA